jgi:Carboxypeptidase regulatory-like domain
VVSDNNGNWEVPSVRVGNYHVTASLTGFTTAVVDNISLSVGTRQRIDLTGFLTTNGRKNLSDEG